MEKLEVDCAGNMDGLSVEIGQDGSIIVVVWDRDGSAAVSISHDQGQTLRQWLEQAAAERANAKKPPPIGYGGPMDGGS